MLIVLNYVIWSVKWLDKGSILKDFENNPLVLQEWGST
jgi:hypothetical protein